MKKTRFAEKVLYLDFDGVLHHEEVYFHPRRGIYINAPGRVLFEWMPILEDLLTPYPEVAIVLSTSWVRVRRYDYTKKQLSPELQKRVIGATFHNREMRKDEFVLKSRGLQIAEDVYRRAPHAWFAIDDDYLGWPEWCRGNLIRTDGTIGISAPKIQEDIRTMLSRL